MLIPSEFGPVHFFLFLSLSVVGSLLDESGEYLAATGISTSEQGGITEDNSDCIAGGSESRTSEALSFGVDIAPRALDTATEAWAMSRTSSASRHLDVVSFRRFKASVRYFRVLFESNNVLDANRQYDFYLQR
jgi:hypothetical protein